MKVYGVSYKFFNSLKKLNPDSHGRNLFMKTGELEAFITLQNIDFPYIINVTLDEVRELTKIEKELS